MAPVLISRATSRLWVGRNLRFTREAVNSGTGVEAGVLPASMRKLEQGEQHRAARA